MDQVDQVEVVGIHQMVVEVEVEMMVVAEVDTKMVVVVVVDDMARDDQSYHQIVGMLGVGENIHLVAVVVVELGVVEQS